MSDRAIELMFLGTGAACPTKERSLPAALVRLGRRRYLVDCGEGFQRQLLIGGCGLKPPDAVLITHVHLDHILGLPGYLSTLARLGRESPIPVYVPGGSRHALKRVMTAPGLDHMADLRDASGTILEFPGGTLSCFELDHAEVPCVGYCFTISGRWHLDPQALQRHGVPDGPLRKELSRGKRVVLPDGSIVLPEQVRGAHTDGLQIVVAGDCSSWEQLAGRVRGVTLLVGEATYLEKDADLARRNGHITATELARSARQAGVRWLVATHLSQRYSAKEYLEELRTVFADSFVAEDLLSVGLTHTGEFFQRRNDEVWSATRM